MVLKNLERKVKPANQVKCLKEPCLSQSIYITFPRDYALGKSLISANVIGSTWTVLAALFL